MNYTRAFNGVIYIVAHIATNSYMAELFQPFKPPAAIYSQLQYSNMIIQPNNESDIISVMITILLQINVFDVCNDNWVTKVKLFYMAFWLKWYIPILT